MPNEPNLLAEGLILLAMGMGFVFMFLTLLVFATQLMSKIILRFTPLEAASPSSPQSRSANDINPQLISAITAALHFHRSKQDR